MTQWNDPQSNETQRLPRQQAPYAQQPPYPQPYGSQQPPPGAGHPGYYDTTANPFGVASDQAFGIVSAVLGLLGGILGVVTLTGLDWFKGGRTFSDTDSALSSLGDQANGFSAAYFSWLAWAFLIVAVLAAVMASFPSPALRAFRIIGVVVGFAAAGLTFLALQLADGSSWTENFKAARVGFYFAVLAFVLAGIGAAIGPRKV